MENLIVLNNEKVSKHNGKFFSRNYNFKILPEGLNRYFKVEYIVRKSEVNESHELKLDNIKIENPKTIVIDVFNIATPTVE